MSEDGYSAPPDAGGERPRKPAGPADRPRKGGPATAAPGVLGRLPGGGDVGNEIAPAKGRAAQRAEGAGKPGFAVTMLLDASPG